MFIQKTFCFRTLMNLAVENLQLTLAIIKPHVIKVPYALQDIRDKILAKGFYVVRNKRVHLSEAQVEEFYAEHKEKFFYHRLITFMQSGPCDVYVLARKNAIQEWRKLMGPTKVYQAQYTHPDSIRGCYGLSDTRNASHGSDSPEAALKEISFFFMDIDIGKWFAEDEPLYKAGSVAFNTEEFIHTIKNEKPSCNNSYCLTSYLPPMQE
ncbi:nucleoside diphosphate kinase 6 isoform X1 [Schistocerca cancellata]|uniref:nucleoside diphosphate kinase 6 isoform X1 n=1 Tax=Schistocerca cancellata TaxID=274614 RepID=UPI0021188616|nr:nucleoside diphosphate kinase 6 isoform X1 [Schistocerca cancellata]